MLTTELHARIADVGQEDWDALGHDPLSSHAMLTVLEGGNLPGVRMWYATVKDWTGKVVAAAPLTRIDIDGGKLAHGLFRSLISVVRRGHDGFLRTKLMVCGTPLSVGNPPIRWAVGVDRPAVARELAGLLDELGDREQVPWRVFKELSARELPAANLALLASHRPWLIAPSEPNASLDIHWETYDGYLASLRSHYRYKIRAAARKAERAGMTVETVSLGDVYSEEIHALYDAVHHRAEVQFEHLTPEFFRRLGHEFGDSTPLILFRRDGAVIGWVCMLFAGGVAYDLFHGIDYRVNDEVALYFNQIAAVIRLAIERRANHLSLGQSTEIAKARFGARNVPLWIGLRHRSGTVTAVLRGGRRVLFPERDVPDRHVFRAPAEYRMFDIEY